MFPVYLDPLSSLHVRLHCFWAQARGTWPAQPELKPRPSPSPTPLWACVACHARVPSAPIKGERVSPACPTLPPPLPRPLVANPTTRAPPAPESPGTPPPLAFPIALADTSGAIDPLRRLSFKHHHHAPSLAPTMRSADRTPPLRASPPHVRQARNVVALLLTSTCCSSMRHPPARDCLHILHPDRAPRPPMCSTRSPAPFLAPLHHCYVCCSRTEPSPSFQLRFLAATMHLRHV